MSSRGLFGLWRKQGYPLAFVFLKAGALHHTAYRQCMGARQPTHRSLGALGGHGCCIPFLTGVIPWSPRACEVYLCGSESWIRPLGWTGRVAIDFDTLCNPWRRRSSWPTTLFDEAEPKPLLTAPPSKMRRLCRSDSDERVATEDIAARIAINAMKHAEKGNLRKEDPNEPEILEFWVVVFKNWLRDLKGQEVPEHMKNFVAFLVEVLLDIPAWKHLPHFTKHIEDIGVTAPVPKLGWALVALAKADLLDDSPSNLQLEARHADKFYLSALYKDRTTASLEERLIRVQGDVLAADSAPHKEVLKLLDADLP